MITGINKIVVNQIKNKIIINKKKVMHQNLITGKLKFKK